MADVTRRQLMQGLLALGSCAGLGLLAACGRPEPTSGLGGQSVPVTPVGTTLPGTPGTPGYLPTPTAMPTALGTVVLPTAPTGPYPGSDIRTPIILSSPLPYITPRPSDPLRVTIAAARDGNPRLATTLSTLVITGTVVEAQSARWSTPDGRRPADPRDQQSPYGIITPMFLRVDRLVLGVAVPVRLAAVIPEGAVGEDYVRYSDGIYSFSAGQQVVLFLKPSKLPPLILDGLPTWDIIDRYTVTPTQQATNSYQTLPLQDLRDIIVTVGGHTQPTQSATPSRSSPVATP